MEHLPCCCEKFVNFESCKNFNKVKWRTLYKNFKNVDLIFDSNKIYGTPLFPFKEYMLHKTVRKVNKSSISILKVPIYIIVLSYVLTEGHRIKGS